MATYVVTFIDPTIGPEDRTHELEAASDAQARIRFMNLSWVAFTAIFLKSVWVKPGQKAGADELAGVQPHAYRGRHENSTADSCQECRQPYNHPLHAGMGEVLQGAKDRTNSGAKRGVAAVKAAAAGIENHALPTTPNVVVLPVIRRVKAVDPHSLKPFVPPPPPPPTVGSLTDEIDRLKGVRDKALGRNDHASAAALTQRINQTKRERHALLGNGEASH